MTKAEIARAVYNRHGGLSFQDAQRIVDLIFESIKQRLLNGERVHIVGFGTMEAVTRRPRSGRNPVTGEIDKNEPPQRPYGVTGVEKPTPLRGVAWKPAWWFERNVATRAHMPSSLPR